MFQYHFGPSDATLESKQGKNFSLNIPFALSYSSVERINWNIRLSNNSKTFLQIKVHVLNY